MTLRTPTTLTTLKNTNDRPVVGVIFFVFVLLSFCCAAFAGPQDSQQTWRGDLDALKHALRNHELEIRSFEEKLKNQDASMESLQKQIQNTAQVLKDNLKGNQSSIEEKNASIDQSIKGVASDIKLLKNHLNESSQTLSLYDEKIRKLEKVMEVQAQNLKNLEEAVDTLIEALEVKHAIPDKPASISTSCSKSYKVRPGDTLEKIAKENQTTIQAIKELNNLTKDRIIVGQTLQLP